MEDQKSQTATEKGIEKKNFRLCALWSRGIDERIRIYLWRRLVRGQIEELFMSISVQHWLSSRGKCGWQLFRGVCLSSFASMALIQLRPSVRNLLQVMMIEQSNNWKLVNKIHSLFQLIIFNCRQGCTVNCPEERPKQCQPVIKRQFSGFV